MSFPLGVDVVIPDREWSKANRSRGIGSKLIDMFPRHIPDPDIAMKNAMVILHQLFVDGKRAMTHDCVVGLECFESRCLDSGGEWHVIYPFLLAAIEEEQTISVFAQMILAHSVSSEEHNNDHASYHDG